MNADDIKWEDPSISTGPGSGREADEFIAILQQYPGRWAVYPRRMSTAWPAGLRRRYQSESLEFKTRNGRIDDDGKRRADMYLRWIGPA